MPPINDGEIEVPLDDAPLNGAASDTHPEAGAETGKKIIEPDEGLEVLRAKLEEERAGRMAAEATAREATQAASRAQNEKADTDVQLVTNAVASLKQANDALELRAAEEMAAGNFAEVSKIQREMGKNEARLNTLETGLEHLKNQPKSQPETDPVARFTKDMSPLSAAWIRAHPQYVTDSRLNKKMLAAHYDAEGDGLAVDTPEYFASIERALGLGSNDLAPQEDATSGAAQPTQRRQSPPPGAPVSRGADGNGSRPTTVRLNADEREAAHLSYPDLSERDAEQQYARNKVQLQREGRMN